MARRTRMGGDPKSSLGGPRTAREVAGRPVPGPILFVRSSATRASLPALRAHGATASRATSIFASSFSSPYSSPYSHVVLRLQKHEARRFQSLRASLGIRNRRSICYSAVLPETAQSIARRLEPCAWQDAKAARRALVGWLMDVFIMSLGKNPVCLSMIECCHAAIRASTPFAR